MGNQIIYALFSVLAIRFLHNCQVYFRTRTFLMEAEKRGLVGDSGDVSMRVGVQARLRPVRGRIDLESFNYP